MVINKQTPNLSHSRVEGNPSWCPIGGGGVI